MTKIHGVSPVLKIKKGYAKPKGMKYPDWVKKSIVTPLSKLSRRSTGVEGSA